MKPKSPDELLNLTKSLFEANEDLDLVLIGGLAAQEVYSMRRSRNSSDIDIAVRGEQNDKLIKRLRDNGYEIFYNETLDKYSAFKQEEGIHIDIYPDKVGKYTLDEDFWKRAKALDDIRVASPEDLIGIKIYAYIASERGKIKHMIDIYSIIIGREEIDLEYLKNRLEKVATILDLSIYKILEYLKPEKQKNVLEQFRKKEIRFLEEESKKIIEYLSSEKYLFSKS